MKKIWNKNLCIICLVGVITSCGKDQEDKFISDSEQLSSGVSGQAIIGGDSATDSVGHASSVDGSFNVFVAPPKLSVDRVGNYVGNKITIIANHLRGSLEANSHWQILDGEDILVSEDGIAKFEWTPLEAGIYTVKHTVTEGEAEISVAETLYVLSEVVRDADLIDRFWTFDEKLIGTWTGEIVSSYGKDVHVDLVFYTDGSYSLSRIYRDDIFPRYPIPPPPFTEPPFLPTPIPAPPMDVIAVPEGGIFTKPFPGGSMITFNKEKGNYELLDVWANGEVVGNMQPENYPPMNAENMTRVRFTEDYNMVFFELALDPFFFGESDTFVLTRVSDSAEPPSLDVITEKLVGDWKGSVMAPWAMPYEVSFQFSDDGTYMAQSLTETMLHDGEMLGRVSPLYFGAVDSSSDMTRYSIDKYMDDKASGDIIVELKNGDLVSGTISDLEMSVDYSILVFTFKHYGKYGPMRYVLERQ